jgi:hypothetical protein
MAGFGTAGFMPGSRGVDELCMGLVMAFSR